MTNNPCYVSLQCQDAQLLMRSNTLSTVAAARPTALLMMCSASTSICALSTSFQGAARTALAALELGLHPQQCPLSVRVSHRRGSCLGAVLCQRGCRRWRAVARLLGARIVPLPFPDGRCCQSPVVQRIMDEHLRKCSNAGVLSKTSRHVRCCGPHDRRRTQVIRPE